MIFETQCKRKLRQTVGVDKFHVDYLYNSVRIRNLNGITNLTFKIMSVNNYAGFWLRFVAIIIDGIILWIVNMIILSPVMGMIGLNLATGGFDFSSMNEGDIIQMATTLIQAAVLGSIVMRVVDLLYHSAMESSKFQGSVGKMALGLKVTVFGSLLTHFLNNSC